MSWGSPLVFLSEPNPIFISHDMVKRVYRPCSQGFVLKLELLFEDGLRGNDGLKREIPDPVIADTGIVGGLDTYRGLEFRVQGLGLRV